MNCLKSQIKELRYSNFTSEEWKDMESLTDYKQIVIRNANKRFCLVVWDRKDYLLEYEKQLKDENIFKPVTFNENLLENVTDFSNKLFEYIRRGGNNLTILVRSKEMHII